MEVFEDFLVTLYSRQRKVGAHKLDPQPKISQKKKKKNSQLLLAQQSPTTSLFNEPNPLAFVWPLAFPA